jgi:hypothetical protein
MNSNETPLIGNPENSVLEVQFLPLAPFDQFEIVQREATTD